MSGNPKPVFGGGAGIFGNFSFRGNSSTSTTEDEQPTQLNVLPVSQTAMRAFNPKDDQWNIYHEQLENYFDSLGCTEDDAKRTFLLNCLGTGPYTVVRSMCAPTLPAKKTYKELCTILKQHYVPQIVTLIERRAFYEISRKDGESAVEWLTKVRNASINCDFGDKLEFVILEKFATGLSGKAFDRVCEESTADLTLEKALKLAIKYEKATAPAGEINFVSSTKGKQNSACKHCGYKNHAASDCKFRQCKCHRCGVTGHMARVCKQKGEVNMLDSDKVIDIGKEFHENYLL